MKTKDQDGYDDWKAKNADAYSRCVFEYAEQWAEAMEEDIEQGRSVADVAKLRGREVDERPGMGITGFMYGFAVQILAACWVHGEDLRRWHNLDVQFGSEGEEANETGGVLNPAVLSIDTAG